MNASALFAMPAKVGGTSPVETRDPSSIEAWRPHAPGSPLQKSQDPSCRGPVKLLVKDTGTTLRFP